MTDDITSFDLVQHIKRQSAWSSETFGPGARTKGVIAHIQSEIYEVEENPEDLSEWIDIIILAIDGATRIGFTAEEIAVALKCKQLKNEGRKWPDWRNFSQDESIEHIKE
jgi:hypothetical protein